MGPAHLAAGLVTKSASVKAPLWLLLLASEFIDLLCFAFIAIGIESAGVNRVDLQQGLVVVTPGSIPWSHGLFMALVWSLLTAAIAYLFLRERRASGIVGLVVFSHWLLDFIVHPRDLPLLFSGSPTVGLGLWTSGPGLIASILLEVVLLAGGIAFYLIARKRKAAQTRVGASA
jgi:membrane-bound metal-dependent hydrolase YbcI (DUF457 family)